MVINLKVINSNENVGKPDLTGRACQFYAHPKSGSTNFG